MKASELRLGNFIQDKFGVTDVVRELNNLISDRVNVDIYDDYFSPIPLTEDWLVKFGFSGNEMIAEGLINGYSLKYIDYGEFSNKFVIVQASEGYYLAEDGDFELFVYPSSRPFRFLHQLQNLYFALTGQELTIN